MTVMPRSVQAGHSLAAALRLSIGWVFHVLTTITIEDTRAAQDKRTSNVASLTEEFGRKGKRVGATVWP
jgi:hypothetical protein